MKPKEKANELIGKFIEPTKVPNIKGIWVEDIQGAKQCALISANLVLEEIEKVFIPSVAKINSTYRYWVKVKKHLEND